VPFATAPVGPLRWRASKPAPRWEGVRPALRFGPACPQHVGSFGELTGARQGSMIGDEDCLTLDIWAPRFRPDSVPTAGRRMPVMVWLHGGGNTIGHTAWYDGGNLAATHGLVVITVHHRLGPLGFLRHEALRASATNGAEASGNFATLDLVRALEWVRDNVTFFGGDPDNVTIFGESSGATNVFSLLLAPQARGLFHRAIAQSGALRLSTAAESEHFVDDIVPGHENSSNEALLRLLLREGARDRESARARLSAMTDTELARWLRGVPVRELLAAWPPRESGMIDMPKLFADGVVLPTGDPLTQFAFADSWNRVPVLLGTNRDESRLFLFMDRARVRHPLGLLPEAVDEGAYLVDAEYLSRIWKVIGADEPASAIRASASGVFVYRFDWDQEPTLFGVDLGTLLGAAHGMEIPFVFGHFDFGRRGSAIFDRSNAESRRSVSHAMMSYWAAFARDGMPGRGMNASLPLWPAFDGRSDTNARLMIFASETQGGVRVVGLRERRDRVLADVAADMRLPTPRERCRVFRELASAHRGFDPSDYARIAGPECAAFPFDAFPWLP
jgi:para-nitrobenzyl esterase